MKTIGDRIRERRKELDMSAEEMAEKLGKNRATIYRYESGDIKTLPSDVLEPIARVLQTTPADLLGYVESEKETDSTLRDDERTLLTRYNQLNAKGQTALNEYVDYLESNPRFTKDTTLRDA